MELAAAVISAIASLKGPDIFDGFFRFGFEDHRDPEAQIPAVVDHKDGGDLPDRPPH